MDNASSEKFLLSWCFSWSWTEGNLKLNFFLFGEAGVVGAGADIDLYNWNKSSAFNYLKTNVCKNLILPQLWDIEGYYNCDNIVMSSLSLCLF